MKKYFLFILVLCFCKFIFAQNLSDCITLNRHDGEEKGTDFEIIIKEPNCYEDYINMYVYNSNPFLLGRITKCKNKEHRQKEKTYTACLSSNYSYPVVASESGCSRQQWLITDRNIIMSNLLCNFPDSIREKIVYSYSEGRDSVFQNLIDFEQKNFLSENIYYYPLRDSHLSYIILENIPYTNQIKDIETILKEKNLLDRVSIRKHYTISIFIPILSINEK